MNDNKQQPIGIINEVGDLGLGFEVLNKKDQEKLNREKEKNK